MPDYSLFGDEHVRQYIATGGEVGHLWNGVPCLILTTTRAKAGTPRTVPLIYGHDGERFLIVASKGGAPKNPLWYNDLVAHPDVELQVGAEQFPAAAQTAAAEERVRLWPIMTAIWPDYDAYQERTEREIPLVVLSRR